MDSRSRSLRRPDAGFGRPWLVVAILVSMAMVAATGSRRLVAGDSALYGILRTLDLSSENVIAAWWSGMLLLLASLHAYDGAERVRVSGDQLDEAGTTRAARAWMAIAGILLFFSADEVASLHERFGMLAWPFGYSEFVAYGIVALVLGGLAIFALHDLWRIPDRASAVGLFVGFALLASVALQEYLEHTVQWSGLSSVLRVMVEEGTELIAILLILFVTMPNTNGMHLRASEADLDREGPRPFGALRPPGWRTVALGFVVCVGFAALSASLSDQQRGHPADWLAAAGFLCSALLEFRGSIRRLGPSTAGAIGREDANSGADVHWSNDGRARRVLTITGIIASAAAVALAPVDLVEVGPVWLNVRLTALSALVGLIAILGYQRSDPSAESHGGSSGRRAYLLLGGTAVLASGVGLVVSTHLFLSYLFTTLLGFGCYVATAFQAPRALRA